MTRQETLKGILDAIGTIGVKTELKHLGSDDLVPTIYEHRNNYTLWCSNERLWYSDEKNGMRASISFIDITLISIDKNDLWINGRYGCMKLHFSPRVTYTLNADLDIN